MNTAFFAKRISMLLCIAALTLSVGGCSGKSSEFSGCRDELTCRRWQMRSATLTISSFLLR